MLEMVVRCLWAMEERVWRRVWKRGQGAQEVMVEWYCWVSWRGGRRGWSWSVGLGGLGVFLRSESGWEVLELRRENGTSNKLTFRRLGVISGL